MVLDIRRFSGPLRGDLQLSVVMNQGHCLLEVPVGYAVTGIDFSEYPKPCTMRAATNENAGNIDRYYDVCDPTGNKYIFNQPGISCFGDVPPNLGSSFRFVDFFFDTGDTGVIINFYLRSLY